MRVAKSVALALLVALGALGAPAIAQDEELGPRIGIGVGLPYGGLGVNYETGKRLSPTGSLGWAIGGPGWNVGARYYLGALRPGKLNWRVTAAFGVCGIAEAGGWTPGYSVTDDYKTVTGFSLGIGYRGAHWDLDLTYGFAKAPAGYELVGGGAPQLSFGYGF